MTIVPETRSLSENDLAAAVLADALVQAEETRIAKQIVSAAKSYTPVRTGALASKWHTETRGGRVKAVNRSPLAHLIEFGTVHAQAFAPGQKAAAQFGGSVDDHNTDSDNDANDADDDDGGDDS